MPKMRFIAVHDNCVSNRNFFSRFLNVSIAIAAAEARQQCDDVTRWLAGDTGELRTLQVWMRTAAASCQCQRWARLRSIGQQLTSSWRPYRPVALPLPS